MKRLLLVIACVLLLVGPAAGDITFDFMYLRDWTGQGIMWNTQPDGSRYLLGVSSNPGGPLLTPNPHGELSLSENNVYYLYAGNLDIYNSSPGSLHEVCLYTNYTGPGGQGGVSPYISTYFNPVGSPGNFQLWKYYQTFSSGIPLPLPTIHLGWAQGTPDLMSQSQTAGGDEKDDIYLVLGIGVEPTNVPLPGAVWLLGSGLVGLIGLRRKFRV